MLQLEKAACLSENPVPPKNKSNGPLKKDDSFDLTFG